MREIEGIAIHCTAGFGDIPSIKRFWREVLEWEEYGYNIIVKLNGEWELLAPLSRVTNGIRGYNSKLVHISYIGGVDPNNYKIAKDTRTEAQKAGILSAIYYVLEELKGHQDISNLYIKGHRDFSPDKNGNGIVDSWERIKECPSFDAIPEYEWIMR